MPVADGIFAQWTQLFGEAISSMAAQATSVSVSTLSVAPEELDWLGQKLSLTPEVLIWLGAPTTASGQIGKVALAGAGLEDPSPEDIAGTFRELVGQALSGVAQAVGRLIQKEVTCGGGLETVPSPAEQGQTFEVRIGETVIGPLQIVVSSKLIALLEATQAPPSVTPDTPQREPLSSEGRGRIDLLLDVEMPVRVSFGKAQLLLRDVIKLTTGSIVELDRSVNEPVEVLVNNCVIARGEVVVVDGNYGVRIHQIISRQERLQSVK